MFTTHYLDSHSTTDPKPEILSAVLTGNRISGDGRNVRGIMHVHVCRKDDIFRQRRLNHSGVGGGIAFRRVYPARAYSTVVVLVIYMVQYAIIQHFDQKLQKTENFYLATIFKVKHRMSSYISTFFRKRMCVLGGIIPGPTDF